MRYVAIFIFLFSVNTYAQFGTPDIEQFDDEEFFLSGGDIFTDFNEDIESSQVLEDERFYRYGRFFSLHLGLGLTTFSGNRGDAYTDDHPSFNLAVNIFQDFNVSYVLGFAYSKHNITINEATNNFSNGTGAGANVPGSIDVNMLRVFFGFRYYVDTTDLGTAITYSNPYFTGRLEYWYVTNKYLDYPDLGDDSGGGIGMGVGGGLEWPIELKEKYINFEFLIHSVAFHDINTQDYDPVYEDLSGYGFTYFLNYVVAW